MPTRFVTIQNKVYQFDYDYKNTDFRREALNRMTKETWGFSFEHWYQNGFWPDSCVPYSLFDLQKMVSHGHRNDFHLCAGRKNAQSTPAWHSDDRSGLSRSWTEPLADRQGARRF